MGHCRTAPLRVLAGPNRLGHGGNMFLPTGVYLAVGWAGCLGEECTTVLAPILGETERINNNKAR